MFRTARKLAQVRYKNKITLIELEEQGYIRRSHKHGETSFFITKDGKRRLHDVYKQTSHYVQHPEKWDGSWRVISYDFPEQQRSQRNSLRYVLTKSGFLKIQKSIWIFPYEVPLLISLLSEDPIISACCVYMKSAGLTGEARYKMYFKLK